MTEPTPAAEPARAEPPRAEPISTGSKRAARGRATREQLIHVATRLFSEQGYEGTSIEDVLADAGVSRGALYHHFAGKDALFAAVVESVENRVMADLAAVAGDIPDAVGRLRVAALTWIGMAADPAIARITLLDAPSVLGIEHWVNEDQQQALTAMKALLADVSAEGLLAPALVAPFASMILGALDQMALVVARAQDPEAALPGARAAVEELLRRVLTP